MKCFIKKKVSTNQIHISLISIGVSSYENLRKTTSARHLFYTYLLVFMVSIRPPCPQETWTYPFSCSIFYILSCFLWTASCCNYYYRNYRRIGVPKRADRTNVSMACSTGMVDRCVESNITSFGHYSCLYSNPQTFQTLHNMKYENRYRHQFRF